MSDRDIFDEENKPNEGTPPSEENKNLDGVLDVFAEKLMSITKEDGTPKYDSIDKALDALRASQDHIKRLEGENADHQNKLQELTEAANRAAELEEIVRRMSNGENQNEEKPQVSDPNNKGGLSEQEAAELVKRILKEEKQVSTAVENVKTVNDKLVSKFGDKAKDVIAAKAKELGVTNAQLKELSATSPAMVLALFGDTTSSPSPSASSINSSGLKPAVPKLDRPDKSLLSGSGATDTNRAEFMRKIKEDVYKRLEIT